MCTAGGTAAIASHVVNPLAALPAIPSTTTCLPTTPSTTTCPTSERYNFSNHRPHDVRLESDSDKKDVAKSEPLHEQMPAKSPFRMRTRLQTPPRRRLAPDPVLMAVYQAITFFPASNISKPFDGPNTDTDDGSRPELHHGGTPPKTLFRTWTCPGSGTPSRWKLNEEPVVGLHAALAKAGLSSYEAAADAWCKEAGAAFLEELAGEEELEGFCAEISPGGLPVAARQRLLAAIIAVRGGTQQEHSSALSQPSNSPFFPSVRSW